MGDKDVSQKDHRFKVIVVATISAALIIAIGVWAITSAINSTKNNNTVANNPEETTKTEEKKEDTVATTDTTTTSTTGFEPVSPSSEYTVSAPVVSTGSNDIPKTGPSEMVISALALGTIVALIMVNINLVKERQT